MKPILLSLIFATCLVGSSSAQTVTENGAKSDEILRKMRQLDAMVQIIPLALTKEQVKDILPAIEKARQKELEIRKLEDGDLAKLDAKLTAAIAAAVEKGAYPPRELQLETFRLTRALGIRRQVALNEMTDLVFDAVKKSLNAGQKKVMENSLKPELVDPSIKVDKMSSDEKIRFYIKRILLEEAAYELLVKMSK